MVDDEKCYCIDCDLPIDICHCNDCSSCGGEKERQEEDTCSMCANWLAGKEP